MSTPPASSTSTPSPPNISSSKGPHGLPAPPLDLSTHDVPHRSPLPNPTLRPRCPGLPARLQTARLPHRSLCLPSPATLSHPPYPPAPHACPVCGVLAANLDPAAFVGLSLPYGVYMGWAQVDEGEVHPTVLSFGTNPTFNTTEDTLVSARSASAAAG